MLRNSFLSALALVVLVLLVLLVARSYGRPRQPLLIDTPSIGAKRVSLATTPQDRLFTLCPLMRRNVPSKPERNA